VALQGVEELTEAMRAAREAGGLRALAQAYLDYAADHPAVYEAIFVRPTDLSFGTPDSPSPLKAAFEELRAGVEPYADNDPETLTEVFWSALHGQATLNHTKRLRPTHTDSRVDVLIARLTGQR
jgi:hypothetical protein